MNQKLKKDNKGITLIVVVVTIILLLILAGVTIYILLSGDIVDNAGEAADVTYESTKNEENAIEHYTRYINNEVGVFTQDKTTVTKKNKDGTVTPINVGDVVQPSNSSNNNNNNNNNQGNGGNNSNNIKGWKVLGADNGRLLLMSDENVPDAHGNRTVTLSGQDGFKNGVNILNEYCKQNAKAFGSDDVRCMTADDINRITGYDPEVTGWYPGFIMAYGNEVTYTLSGGVVRCRDSKGKEGTYLRYNSFTWLDGDNWKALKEGESVTIKCDAYNYAANSLLKNSELYNTLFMDSDSGEPNTYWLASPMLYTNDGAVTFCYRVITKGGVAFANICSSNGGTVPQNNFGVRAVVSLDEDVELKDIGNGTWEVQ